MGLASLAAGHLANHSDWVIQLRATADRICGGMAARTDRLIPTGSISAGHGYLDLALRFPLHRSAMSEGVRAAVEAAG
jgi:hypothetical protein